MKSKKLILCIDDDQEILDSLRLILEANNYRVADALTSEDGLCAFEKEKPDMVIVDLMMESVDSGMNFVEKIRKNEKKIPIYLLSGVGDQFHNSCDETAVGFDGVFQKPLKPDTLLKIIGNRIGK